MPFARPSLSQLRTQVETEIAAKLPGSDPALRFSPLRIIGEAQAGLAHGHYGFLDYISRQAVPWTATEEKLEGWGALKGVLRKAATQAVGQVSFNGTNGTVLPAGSLVRSSDGLEFRTTTDGTVANNVVTSPVRAEAAGAASNLAVGTQLMLATSVAGIEVSGWAGLFSGGADVESDDDYRSRVMFEYQKPPRGGAGTDYVTWALAVPGVTRAWCVANGFGAGTVVVYVMLDAVRSAGGGFPTGTNGKSSLEPRSATAATGDQLIVADALYPLQPVTALVYVCAPTQMSVPFTIAGIPSASAATRNRIAQAIDDVFLRDGTAAGGKVNLSAIESDIAAIAGTAGFVITSPATNITLPVGSLPVRGAITYI